ncbi:MAG: sigma-54-dependent transcriptional regulator [Gammaproteobacteria bacterium]
MTQPCALIVDDEPDLCELIGITLQRMGIDTRAAGTLSDAREILSGNHFDLCLTDMRLPDGDGLELIEWMGEHAADVPVAMITAHGNVQTAVRALKLGAFDFVSKPVDLGALRKLVSSVMRLHEEKPPEPPQDTDEAMTSMLGRSEPMQRVRGMIAKVARSQAPVHICGESGTGKELVARMIHESGPRAEQPFIPVNCGAIPAELMESEFFGHRKGSFTGATDHKTGLFRSAEGGTLFLDEVADLPLHMQVKLLRAIQEKAVRPVGESDEVEVDVRILSATHRSLAAMVENNSFREDLFYRINVIELRVPPLRDRGDDKLLLADFFLRAHARAMNDENLSLSPAARARLGHYSFPGNVRELENVLERAATLCSDSTIDEHDLQLRDTATPTSDSAAANLEDQLGDVQRDAIIAALEKTRYNKTAAAKLLGLSFRQLRYRIKKLDIDA